jgi:S-ribosylhomocysteine lyase LuxS involved in autoinducer biosynthesis
LKSKLEDQKVTKIGPMEFFEGRLAGCEVVIVMCGVGKVHAAMCTQVLCSNFGVTHIVNTGVAGSLDAQLDICDVLGLVKDCFCFIRDFRGEVPGASAKDCGNYLDMNLPMANYWGEKYAALLENITPDRLVYPE